MPRPSDATHSADTQASSILHWRRAAICADGNCVEIGTSGVSDIVWIRDSKNVDAGTISCTADQFRAFVSAIKAGTFDLAG
jgi:hypothetical protein